MKTIHHSDISRRLLLKRIACFVSGVSIFPQFVCASNHQTDEELALDHEEMETFEAFIETVIPSSSKYVQFLAQEIHNSFYGFSKYFKFLIRNLNEQSTSIFSKGFVQLAVHEKIQIISDGTKSGLLRKQVYNGAIYLLQLIVFSGICENDQSCEIIDFPGASDRQFHTYSDVGFSNPHSISLDGNPQ